MIPEFRIRSSKLDLWYKIHLQCSSINVAAMASDKHTKISTGALEALMNSFLRVHDICDSHYLKRKLIELVVVVDLDAKKIVNLQEAIEDIASPVLEDVRLKAPHWTGYSSEVRRD
jgi:wyosine [tRNA(Phe)-imidazoG37] synthetase (radical SAM superfamily)